MNKKTAVVLLVACTGLAPLTASAEANPLIEKGRDIAFDRSKGNCLACHAMEKGESPGTIGPPLMMMDTRYPDKERLRAQIWDSTRFNPNTAMPPFGRHAILSEQEIDAVVAYVSSL